MARNPADDMRDYIDEIVDKNASKGEEKKGREEVAMTNARLLP